MKQKIDFRPYHGSLAAKAFDPGDSLGYCYPLNADDEVYSQVSDSPSLDAEKIFLGQAFQRLIGKTQVFSCQNYPYLRNRQTHTKEAVFLGKMAARILGLNSNLVEAILLAHDTGYPAGGHVGEKFITRTSKRTFGHEVMSVVLLQKIYNLNLSWETLQGVLRHRRGEARLQSDPYSFQEYILCSICDKIAILSDYDDALRCGYFTEKQLRPELLFLGENLQERWRNCLFALVKESSKKGFVSFGDSEIGNKFETLLQWSYPNFYRKVNASKECLQDKEDLEAVYDFLYHWRHVVNYDPCLSIAVMTDQEMRRISKFSRYPTIADKNILDSLGFAEILLRLPKDSQIDIFDASLHAEDFHQV
ncbi:MAG: HD domain-containing protein [Patescibacteria group bacterium]|jgi:hypothetical protein